MNQAPKNNLWREKDKIGHAPRAAASRQADAIKPAGDAARNWIREQTVAGQVGFVRANDRPLRGGERQIRRGHEIIRLVRPTARGKNQIRSQLCNRRWRRVRRAGFKRAQIRRTAVKRKTQVRADIDAAAEHAAHNENYIYK